MQHSTIDNHWVFITNETGMASVFPRLKQKLTEDLLTAITILYHSHNNHFHFRKELDILEWHFSARLYVSYELSTDDESILNQKSVEAVINANTAPAINFIISGNHVFTETTREILKFLGVHDIAIQEQFFSR